MSRLTQFDTDVKSVVRGLSGGRGNCPIWCTKWDNVPVPLSGEQVYELESAAVYEAAVGQAQFGEAGQGDERHGHEG